MNENKTHMDALNPKPHIRTSDFQGNDVTLTIRKHGTVSVFNKRTNDFEDKGVLYFDETKKYLILNKTQLDQVAGITKSEYLEDWIGKRITLYVTQVRVGKGMEDAIRVKAPAPAPAAPAPSTGGITKEDYRRLVDDIGMDDEQARAILRESGNDFGVAYKKIETQFAAVLENPPDDEPIRAWEDANHEDTDQDEPPW